MCRHSNARAVEKLHFLNSLSPRNVQQQVQIFLTKDPSLSKLGGIQSHMTSARTQDKINEHKNSMDSLVSKGLPKKRIKKNFIRDRVEQEEKIEKLSKGGKIQYIIERLLYERQVEQMSSDELDMIEDFSSRLKQLKEIVEKSPEELAEERDIVN